jgi:hypothetical protein
LQFHRQITWQHADPLPVPTFAGSIWFPRARHLLAGTSAAGAPFVLQENHRQTELPMPRSLLVISGAVLLAAGFAHAAGAMSRKAALAEIETTRRLNMEQAALNKRALPPQPKLAQLPPRAAPTTKVETHARDAMVPVSALVDPPRDIAIATVRDAGGTVVGAVQRVELAGSGAPSRLEVAMLSDQDHLVSLDASRLRYDAQTNEVRMSRRVATN